MPPAENALRWGLRALDPGLFTGVGKSFIIPWQTEFAMIGWFKQPRSEKGVWG